MHRLTWIDASGIDALTQLWRQLQRRGIGLWLCALEDEPLQRVRDSGLQALLGDEHVLPSVQAALQRAAAHPS
jgi:SulP family sulfate permease